MLLPALLLALAMAAEAPPPPSLTGKWNAAPEVIVTTPVKAAAPAKPGATRIGEHRLLTAAQLAKGARTKSVWRLAIRSKGAVALRLHFVDFHAGAGQVWVHNGKEWFGPYTDRGVYGDGDFWSHVVPGERIVIEYSAAKVSKLPPFGVREVSHLTVDPAN